MSGARDTVDVELRALALRAAALATAEHATAILAAEGIACVLLKGAALALDVYSEDEPRTFCDVDVLVLPEHFADAVRCLKLNGYHDPFEATHALSRTLTGPASPLQLDVHGALYSRGLFDTSARDVVARAQRITGTGLLRASGLDLVAHAIGHFAKTRPLPDPSVLATDLARIVEHDGLDVSAVAAHLQACGLARAAEYALGHACDRSNEAVPRALETSLRADAVGGAALALARRWESKPAGVRRVASTHLLNTSLARAGVSFAFHALDGLLRRARSRLSRRP